MSDAQLLLEFRKNGSEAAFSQIMERHYVFVLATCRRELSNLSMADDAAQVVFLLLSKKADNIHPKGSLAGWLFQTARLVCKNLSKQERIRQNYEQKTNEEQLQQNPVSRVWSYLEPHINDGLASMNASEREILLLRYFEGMSLADTGSTLGISEDAARMRISRVLSKLRTYLSRRGFMLESDAFNTLLLSNSSAIHNSPTITHLTPTPYSAQLTEGIMRSMIMTKLKIATAVVVLATICTITFYKTTLRAAPVRTSAFTHTAADTSPIQPASIPAGTFASLYSFSGPDGAYPSATPIQVGNGVFYGTTEQGGANGQGTVFKLTADGKLSTIHTFAGGKDGDHPEGQLLVGNDGNFYGTTSGGGENDQGTGFRITPNGELTTLYSADSKPAQTTKTFSPSRDGSYYETKSGFVQSKNNAFITISGGRLRIFPYAYGRANFIPRKALGSIFEPDKDGVIYYITDHGGANKKGSIVRFSAKSHVETVYSFAGPDGSVPRDGLFKSSDGSYYGTTYVGGTHDKGTFFKWTPSPGG